MAKCLCTQCGNELPLTKEYWHLRNDNNTGYKMPCKSCRNKSNREAYHDNALVISQRRAVIRLTDAKKYDTYLRSLEKYGLVEQNLRDLMDSQKGCCGICGETLHWKHQGGFHIDHDHSTGDVRGILCSECNTGLGKFNDSRELMEKGMNYLGTTTINRITK